MATKTPASLVIQIVCNGKGRHGEPGGPERIWKMRPRRLTYRLIKHFTCRRPYIVAALERSTNSELPGGRGFSPSLRM